MNYTKIYYDIIESRKILNREKTKLEYFEKHHIIPKSLGGTDENKNLVLLTPKEHFLCHKLLLLITKEKYGIGSSQHHKMCKALVAMQNYSRYKVTITSRQYSQIKNEFRLCMSIRMSKMRKGTKLSDEHKKKLSISTSNRRWMYNPKTLITKYVKSEEQELYKSNGYIFGRIIDQSGSKNPIHFHKFTQKDRIQKSKVCSQRNKIYHNSQGKIWINNSIHEKYVFPDQIPDGYVKGRLK